jgi:hypothetical protein
MRMITVWKYLLKPVGEQTINAPILQILTVRAQNGKATLWALVDSEGIPTNHKFSIVQTGTPAPTPVDKWEYVGMFFQLNGEYVGHVFHQRRV